MVPCVKGVCEYKRPATTWPPSFDCWRQVNLLYVIRQVSILKIPRFCCISGAGQTEKCCYSQLILHLAGILNTSHIETGSFGWIFKRQNHQLKVFFCIYSCHLCLKPDYLKHSTVTITGKTEEMYNDANSHRYGLDINQFDLKYVTSNRSLTHKNKHHEHISACSRRSTPKCIV